MDDNKREGRSVSVTVLASVRYRFALLAFCAFATSAVAQTPGVSPSSFSQGDEAFLQISLAGLTSTDYALVTFTGPGGTSALEPQFVVDGSLIVWVPESAMNNPGTYSVYVDVTREGTTTRYGPAQITVTPLPDPGFSPSLTLPEVVTAEAVSAAGAVVTFSATSTDGAPVSCSPPSGSVFPLGTSTVTCSAGSASAFFPVFVYDTGRPVLTVPGDISTSNAVVTYTVSATDAIDPAPTVECTPPSGSTLPFGITVVGCTAVDHHANSDFRTFRVTITNGAPVTISNVTVSEPFFSPNADGSKDTTTVSANATSADTSWTVTVSSPTGAAILTANRPGAALSFTWDGRDAGGIVQPDGTYTFALKAVDGIHDATVTTSAVVDRTNPTASIASPSSGQIFSNVRQNGSTGTTVTGTTSDANLLDWNASAGPSGGSLTVFSTGTTAVSNATLGTWVMGAFPNGTYVVRLEVRDRAGNTGVTTTAVTIAHFSASQSTYEMNTASGQTVVYTSVVPFALTQTLTIRNSAGTTVRTLVNGSREVGTYNDSWDGRDDGGTLLPDGPYSYFATVTEGTNVLTWDLSNQMRASTETALPYPSCSSKTMSLDTCAAHAQSGGQYDLFANDPLKIHYSVAQPSRVYVVFTNAVETPGFCSGSEICVTNGEYRATGSYVDTWAGVLPDGSYAPLRSKLTVVRRTSTFPQNVVVLHGSGPAAGLANLTLTPIAFGPDGGSMKIEFDLATSGNAAATVTLQMFRQATSTSAMSTLSTITLSAQTPGHVTYLWDGKADSGHWVAPGEYALIVSAAASGGSSQAKSKFAVIY
jgi:flagellar hook assembly protein FlgD